MGAGLSLAGAAGSARALASWASVLLMRYITRDDDKLAHTPARRSKGLGVAFRIWCPCRRWHSVMPLLVRPRP